MNNLQLSICIPTYNREKYLKEAIESITCQLDDSLVDKVEICISDNASTDNTKQLIENFQKQYKNITYFRQNQNMGADCNYLKVIEIAHGKYCWFLGSDDAIVNGAINKMLIEIYNNYDIYLCNRYECDINMNIISKTSFVNKNISKKVFKFSDISSVENYLKYVKELGGVFSYLSTIIFKKSQWDNIEYNPNFMGTAYAHSYILLSIMKNNTTLKYLYDKYLIMNRNGNDSFNTNSIIKRIELDFNGYQKLFTVIFSDNKKLRNYYKIILRKQFYYCLISGLYETSNINDKRYLLSFVKETHNILIIKFISIFYYIYRKFIKRILQKLNIHKKIVKILFK